MKVLNKKPLSLEDRQIDIISFYLNFCFAISVTCFLAACGIVNLDVVYAVLS